MWHWGRLGIEIDGRIFGSGGLIRRLGLLVMGAIYAACEE